MANYYSLAEFSRKKGSRDKKKRKSRNAYGLTSEQVKQGQIETRNSAIKGGTIGLAATALPAYLINKNLAKKIAETKVDYVAHSLLGDSQRAARSAEAFGKFKYAKKILPYGVLGTGLAGGVLVANGMLSQKRAKKAKAYRKNVLGLKKGYRVNTKEKYNFWHNV